MSADEPKFYVKLGWGHYAKNDVWRVWKRSKGGDRRVADASSERTARLIAKALNVQEGES